MLKAENIVSYKQYLVSIFIIWILVIILIGRFFQIQIMGHDQYSKKANTNRIRKVTSTAPRGLILDRNGQILVDNSPTYVLTAIPGELSHKEKKFNIISDILGLDSLTVSKNYKKYYRGKFLPARIAKDLTFNQLSQLEENKINLGGIYYEQFPERYFPSKVNASHILGYVREIDKPIRSGLDQKNEYEIGDMIGWIGLEKQYESFLKGIRGIYFYEVDAFGREVGQVQELEPQNPEPGKNIVTTLDMEIQYKIEEIMVGKKGVIMVGNPETGAILGAVSAPFFEPDLFTGLMLEKDWEKVLQHPDKPLFNRMIQGLYPPGSIVKMVTASNLLTNPEFDPKITKICEGHYQFGDRLFGCWSDLGHGAMDLTAAILNSCDIYFYKNVHLIDLNDLSRSFQSFGFGHPTQIDIPGELIGIVPTMEYMNTRYGRYGWSKGALLNICIGQGELLVTPIQVFNYINLLATRGKAGTPHLVMVDNIPENISTRLDTKHWDRIISDMRNVIIHKNGTGRRANPDILGMDIYGKTGTAENPHGENHAWFIGWAEYGGAKLSIVVLLENSGSGGAVAAPVAQKVFNQIATYNQFTFND